ncbi:MAG: hypothetical protein AAF694_05485 [Bacteroidota bacterium]
MDIKEAQLDMRQAYLKGAAGVLVSGLVWLAAGFVALGGYLQPSILVFFLGGMLIHPLGLVVSKLFKRSGKHQKENPLAPLAIENSVILFVGLFLAYVIFQVEANWFFPTMLMIIGGRYTLFQTLYGMRIYWALGGILIAAGMACLILSAPFYLGALLGGGIELVFAILAIPKGT